MSEPPSPSGVALPRRGDAGSTLMLFPAAVVVILVLAAITIDLSALHSARFRTERIVTAVVDDAANVVDIHALRAGLEPRLDLDRAARQIADDLRLAELPGALAGPPVIAPGSRPASIAVSLDLDVPRVFAGIVPGAPATERIHVEAIGELTVSR